MQVSTYIAVLKDINAELKYVFTDTKWLTHALMTMRLVADSNIRFSLNITVNDSMSCMPENECDTVVACLSCINGIFVSDSNDNLHLSLVVAIDIFVGHL